MIICQRSFPVSNLNHILSGQNSLRLRVPPAAYCLHQQRRKPASPNGQAMFNPLEENQDFVRGLLEQVLEDIAITRAIEEGEHTSSVSRKEAFEVLHGEQ